MKAIISGNDRGCEGHRRGGRTVTWGWVGDKAASLRQLHLNRDLRAENEPIMQRPGARAFQAEGTASINVWRLERSCCIQRTERRLVQKEPCE